MKTEGAECDTEYYFWNSHSTMACPFCNGEGQSKSEVCKQWRIEWCGRGDSNPQALRRHPLKMVCLPVPPLPQRAIIDLELPVVSSRSAIEGPFVPRSGLGLEARPV